MTLTETKTRASLTIPSEAYDAYERIARNERKPLDQILSERLASCAAYNAKRPIYFNDQQREQLESATGVSVKSAEDVLALVRRCLSVSINGSSVTLTPNLLERMKSRHLDGKPFGKFVGAVAVEKLEEYTGIR